jgi:hypothetical protein
MSESVLNPSPGLLAKLGSIIVHAAEYSSADRHAFDLAAMNAILSDPEVVEWLAGMSKLAMIPKRRKS